MATKRAIMATGLMQKKKHACGGASSEAAPTSS
jgi:hypothetical protein